MELAKRYKLGSETPLSVSEYTGFLNEILKRVKARLIGEVSEFKIAANGHVYFSLRDRNDGSVLKCIVWRFNYNMCGVELKDGLEVIVSGHSDIYQPSGQFSFKAETVELVGEGTLKKAYEELKNRLGEEGLFEEERKRPMPEYPSKIGVITSLHSGTVIHDFMSNLGKFGFRIKAMDSRVEGQEAVKDLLSCIKSFKKHDIDVLVIIRGGGSFQSLMAFDNEVLVREIADFPVPVIAGIGHHKDVTLAALAADASESTPTATANLLNKSWESAIYKIGEYERSVTAGYENILDRAGDRLTRSTEAVIRVFESIFDGYKSLEEALKNNLFKIRYSLIEAERMVKETAKRLLEKAALSFEEKRRLLFDVERTVRLNDPKRQLGLGYSIATHKGKVLKKINRIDLGDMISVEISDGTIDSEVKNKINK